MKKKNCKIGIKHETPLDDLYDCEINVQPFTIIKAEEETFLYAEESNTIQKLLRVFE